MNKILWMAIGAFGYEVLKTKGFIKGFKITDKPIPEQALAVLTNPAQVFLPTASDDSKPAATTN